MMKKAYLQVKHLFVSHELLLMLVCLLLLIASFNTRHPGLKFLRPFDSLLVMLVSVFLIGVVVKAKKSAVFLMPLIFTFLFATYKEVVFQYQKYYVLQSDTQITQWLGRHFIVGYASAQQAKYLAENNLVGGFYITYRNFPQQDRATIRSHIGELQQISQDPLIIATDQEGGIVQRFSPPLDYQPPLQKVISDAVGQEEIPELIKNYANTQSRELKQLGINVNFSPVVDVNYSIPVTQDKYSLISQRAISNDPKIVSQVAQIYVQNFHQNGVYATLKHFPGLGRVQNDTHISSAFLSTPRSELEQSDWIPYKDILADSSAFVMVGHVIAEDIDSTYPSSFSPSILSILREEWGIENIIITDDFSMYAVSKSGFGVGEAARISLENGVDYILVSYDPDLYYQAMYHLITSYYSGKLNTSSIIQSDERIKQLIFLSK